MNSSDGRVFSLSIDTVHYSTRSWLVGLQCKGTRDMITMAVSAQILSFKLTPLASTMTSA
jgi:hypothetical protein